MWFAVLWDNGENLALLTHWVLDVSCYGSSQNPSAALLWNCCLADTNMQAVTMLLNTTTKTGWLPVEKDSQSCQLLNCDQEWFCLR